MTFAVGAGLTAFRPMQGAGSYTPFTKTAVPEKWEEDPDLGPGIRINGDDDNDNGVADRLESGVAIPEENDLIEVTIAPPSTGAQYTFSLEADADLVAYQDYTKQSLFPLGEQMTISVDKTIYVEWQGAGHGTADMRLLSGGEVVDTLTFHTFQSVMIGLSGEAASGNPLTSGMLAIAQELYESGYDAHFFSENDFKPEFSDPVADLLENSVNNLKETKVGLTGHSHGGGDVFQISEALPDHVPAAVLDTTVYVDAISTGGPFSGLINTYSERRRPRATAFHGNIYQRNEGNTLGLRGDKTSRNWENDGPAQANDQLDVTGDPFGEGPISHTKMDEDPNVQEWVVDVFLDQLER